MAQYWRDFEHIALGGVPDDLTQLWAPFEILEVVADTGALNGKSLRLVTPSEDARVGYTFDNIDASADTHVILRVRRAGNYTGTTQFGVAARMAGSSGSESSYQTFFRGTRSIQFTRYTNGSISSLSQQTPGVGTLAEGTDWRFIEMRNTGSLHEFRSWTEGFSQPSFYSITNDVLMSPGGTGIFAFAGGLEYFVDYISVGTAGDMALTEPPEVGLIAPTLITPADTATGVILRPEFTWT